MISCKKTKALLFAMLFALIISVFALISLCVPKGATAEEAYINNIDMTPSYGYLKDNNVNTRATLNSITLKSDRAIKSIYIVFWNEVQEYTLTCGGKTFVYTSPFLQEHVMIPEEITDCLEVTVTFKKAANISDIAAFSEGELPEWVHSWKQPHEKADIMLLSTHADDEQLFFAGVLPYHVAKGYRVQVVYFTDHDQTPGRRHELLNGLWTVGVDRYPVISRFPDAYSTNSAAALQNIKWAGFMEEDVIHFQTEMVRRFKPQVIVGHDLKGEYSHGQHILNIETLIKAVEGAGNAEFYPKSADIYGVWDTPKLYIHLYENNPIVMNWDEPLEYFNGKSAFQMSQAGYKCHLSQQYTWFTDWLNGPYRNFTRADQITTYSPCKYGLYRTTVGEDVEKNSFFENLISYDEQERLEQERLEQERLEQERLEREEQQRLEEESRKAEEERKRLESEAEASRIEESKRQDLENKLAMEKQQKNKTKIVIAAAILFASTIALAVTVIKKHR